MDIASIPKDIPPHLIDKIGQLSRGWTRDSTMAVFRWAVSSGRSLPNLVAHRVDALKPLLSHKQIGDFGQYANGRPPSSRSVQEIAITKTLGTNDLERRILNDDFHGYLVDLIRSIGIADGLRSASVGTTPDKIGYAMRYPEAIHVEPQLFAIGQYIKASMTEGRFCALMAMNLIFNLHPLPDGNGRLGRILFNLINQSNTSSDIFIPLSEVARRCQLVEMYRTLRTLLS